MGVYYYVDGRTYEGDWQNGMKEGKGVEKYCKDIYI